ncbi:MAG: hypothetical protein J7K11_02755 [Candidatus Hydrothermae bacterium]|nr:hypothetical protein [Candidatus Hydrothermae bacterium]
MEYESLLRQIETDNVHGASYLIELGAKAALALLKEGDVSKIPEFAERLMKAQPSMAPILNFGAFLLAQYEDKREDGEEIEKAIIDYVADFRKARGKSLENAENLIENGDTVVTHSFSSSVLEVLKLARERGKDFEVYCTESRPQKEGLELARELSEMGIKTYLTTDMGIFSAIETKASSLLFGVDAFLKSGIVNKVGTAPMAEYAENRGIPVFFVGDSFKILPKEATNYFRIRSGRRDEVLEKTLKELEVVNPYFDVTPYKTVRGIATENGVAGPLEFVEKAFGVNPEP